MRKYQDKHGNKLKVGDRVYHDNWRREGTITSFADGICVLYDTRTGIERPDGAVRGQWKSCLEKRKRRLPEKLSDLIDLAVKDAKACENTPGVELHMWRYHEPGGGQCAVCMAGAVMDQTMRAPRNEERLPEMYSEYNTDRLRAIDAVRGGRVLNALYHLNIKKPPSVSDIAQLICYDYSGAAGRASWDTYTEAAQMLRERGL